MFARPTASAAAAAAPAVAAAAVVALFWLLRSPPPNYGCGEDQLVSDAALTGYRSGVVTLHVLAGAIAVVALAVLSRQRLARKERPGVIGKPTAIALACVAVVALLTLTEWRTGLLVMWTGAIVVGVIGQLGTTTAAVFAAGGLVLGGLSLAPRAARGSRAAPAMASAIAWTVLLLAPGHALVVWLQGDGPLFC